MQRVANGRMSTRTKKNDKKKDDATAAYIKDNYTHSAHTIPMRDGAHLYIVYSPRADINKSIRSS